MCWRYLFSRPVTRQVSSAEVSLTSVFGMGTGGPSPQSTPTIYMLTANAENIYLCMHTQMSGDPYRIRTDVNGVRGHCLNHLTNGPACNYIKRQALNIHGPPSGTRTQDPLIKSQLLYQLS